MRFMIIRSADKNMEAGAMPSERLLAALAGRRSTVRGTSRSSFARRSRQRAWEPSSRLNWEKEERLRAQIAKTKIEIGNRPGCITSWARRSGPEPIIRGQIFFLWSCRFRHPPFDLRMEAYE